MGGPIAAPLMQALARQFNLSETTFLSHSSRATMAVRIFTPDFEMPFAGHPTLGSAHIVRRLAAAGGADHVVLEMPAGLIPVEAVGDRWTLTANASVHREIQRDASWLADALGLQVRDLRWQRGGPRPLWIDTGSDQLIVPLESVEAVRRIAPRIEAFDALRSSAGRRMLLVFAEAGEGRCESRFLFEHDGAFAEDPATGSACANLGGWYLAIGQGEGQGVLTKAFVPRLIAQGTPAQHVITGSQASFLAAPGISPYVAAKHGLWGYADTLRIELAMEQSAVGVSLVAAGSLLAKLFGFLALVMASVNIFGGFLVTQRMLAMYKKKEGKR